jgi:hypothetical protein
MLRGDIVEIPQVGKVVEFVDTDDNVACVMQFEPGLPYAAR